MFYLNTAMLTHLWVVCDCFCITVAELSSCEKDHMASKVENNTCSLAFYKNFCRLTLEHLYEIMS